VETLLSYVHTTNFTDIRKHSNCTTIVLNKWKDFCPHSRIIQIKFLLCISHSLRLVSAVHVRLNASSLCSLARPTHCRLSSPLTRPHWRRCCLSLAARSLYSRRIAHPAARPVTPVLAVTPDHALTTLRSPRISSRLLLAVIIAGKVTKTMSRSLGRLIKISLIFQIFQIL
jgi:hypothetical protein